MDASQVLHLNKIIKFFKAMTFTIAKLVSKFYLFNDIFYWFAYKIFFKEALIFSEIYPFTTTYAESLKNQRLNTQQITQIKHK